jgi:hypothetical protein
MGLWLKWGAGCTGWGCRVWIVAVACIVSRRCGCCRLYGGGWRDDGRLNGERGGGGSRCLVVVHQVLGRVMHRRAGRLMMRRIVLVGCDKLHLVRMLDLPLVGGDCV